MLLMLSQTATAFANIWTEMDTTLVDYSCFSSKLSVISFKTLNSCNLVVSEWQFL